MKLVKFLKFSVCLFFFSTELALAWQPRNIVVFGDSLSDNGNKYQAYQIPVSPPYWHGRFSNGPIWVENLAYQLNLIPNPLMEPNYPRELALRDYAMGDAVVSEKNLKPNSKTRTLMQQLKQYQSEQHNFDPRDTLVIVWIGANDFKTRSCIDSPFNCTKDVIHIQKQFISTLYEFGLRHFLILSLPNLAITPEAHEHFNKEERFILKDLIKYYNNNLALLISQLQLSKDDLDIIEFDTEDFLKEIKANFKKPLYQECYANHSIYDKMVTEPCPVEDQNHYLFWDDLHPTTTAHTLLANRIYDVLTK